MRLRRQSRKTAVLAAALALVVLLAFTQAVDASVGDPTPAGTPLPATSGRMSSFGGPGDGSAGGGFALTGESSSNPVDGWYVAMRWNYGAYPGGKNWLANRRLILTHSSGGTTHTVVVRAADSGPAASTGRVIDVGPAVMDALGATTDDTVTIEWDPSNNLPLGPYSGKMLRLHSRRHRRVRHA